VGDSGAGAGAGAGARKTSFSHAVAAPSVFAHGGAFGSAPGFSGSGSGWDAHEDMESNHSRRCRETDRPIAGLLADLKSRGLLDETLVVWGGEFGRTPFNEKGKGRDHNPWGFTMWMAGGGSKPGTVVGSTDEIGLRASENPIHVHDLHATILHLMGLDHLRLTYPHNGRDERPTINDGDVIRQALA
jgi:uncharacterized protein (DUF1501 family)